VRIRLPSFGCLLAISLLLASGCRPPHQDGRLRLAVSIIPQVWLVKQIAGPNADVISLVAPGESPHTFQPSDAQVSRLMEAAVYFRIGAPFETGPWFQAIEKSGRVQLVDLRRGVEMLAMGDEHEHEHEHDGDHDAKDGDHHPAQCSHCSVDGKDPHIWLSARILKTQAGVIAETLARIDPSQAGVYRANLSSVVRQLDDLDAKVSALLAPHRDKSFIVFHPAWGYFARDYHLKQVAIEVDGKEPSDKELTETQRLARQTGVRVVIVQPQISGRGAQAVAEAVGGRVAVVDPLTEDPLGTLMQMATLIAESSR